MNLILQSLTHGPLLWKDELPASFKGWHLPGGNLRTAEGEFGTVCIQEYQTENFSIRFNVFDIVQDFILSFKIQGSGLFSRLMLKGQVDRQIPSIGEYTLRKNMFTLQKPGDSLITDNYPKRLHLFLETSFSGKLVNELVPLIPQVQKWWEGSSVTTTPEWTGIETMETINAIFQCKHEKDLRRYFFKNRVRDLLLNTLVRFGDHDAGGQQPSEKEIQAAFKAEEIISSDITRHTNIPELAKKVLLNEFSLKAIFKKIFGIGPYEYLVRKRMKKAKELLESGFSVKQVAVLTGHRPTNFTSAFINFYNFPPSAVKKKNS